MARFCMAFAIGFGDLRTAGLGDPDPRRWVELNRQLVQSLSPTRAPKD
jgi:hypothetical protein